MLRSFIVDAASTCGAPTPPAVAGAFGRRASLRARLRRLRDVSACYFIILCVVTCGGASIAFPPRTRGTDVAHTHHMAPGAAALGTRHAARIWTLEVKRKPIKRPNEVDLCRPVLDVYIARASHSHRQSIHRRRDGTRDQAFLTLIVVAAASPQSASVPLTALPWYINTVGAFAPAATTLVFRVSAVSLGATITSTVSSFVIHGISGSVGYDGGVR